MAQTEDKVIKKDLKSLISKYKEQATVVIRKSKSAI